MSTGTAVCEICQQATENVPFYSDWKCAGCGQAYYYNEGHCISLTEQQRSLLRESTTSANTPLPASPKSATSFHFRVWAHPNDGDPAEVEVWWPGMEPTDTGRTITDWIRDRFSEEDFHRLFSLPDSGHWQAVGTADLIPDRGDPWEYSEEIVVRTLETREVPEEWFEGHTRQRLLVADTLPPCRVTLTGVDARTYWNLLPKGCEIGVLFSLRPKGRNRYPSESQVWDIVSALYHRDFEVALHVCGSEARDKLLRGDFAAAGYLRRIQVNGTVSEDELRQLCRLYNKQQIITQATPANEGLLGVNLRNHAVLVDASGGRGKSPEEWVRPRTSKPVGFAGGLGPDNLATELPRIAAVASGDWWIDMESKLRDDDDWFNVGRAHRAVDEVRAFVRQSEFRKLEGV